MFAEQFCPTLVQQCPVRLHANVQFRDILKDLARMEAPSVKTVLPYQTRLTAVERDTHPALTSDTAVFSQSIERCLKYFA
jgi:hypothetical protein